MGGTSASIYPSCEEPLAHGCLADGNHWVFVEHDDGTTELLVAETGAVVDPDDIVECMDSPEATTIGVLELSTPWTTNSGFAGLGNLVAWQVRADVLPVTININGVGVAMDLNEVIGSRAQDNRVLNDTVTINISGAGRAIIETVRRVQQ